MSQHTLRQPFTQEEQSLYNQIFTTLDVESLGIVTGEAARSTFEKSGLPPAILGEIWQLADPTNLGFLNQFAFGVALRLIGHVQSGAKPDKSLIEIAGPLARFQGINSTSNSGSIQQPNIAHTPSASISSQQQSLTPQFTALPPLSNHDISKFAQLFAKSSSTGVLSGDQARQIFLKAKLPTAVLGQIWTLVDTKNVGQLTRDEFIVAMFLIQGTLNNSIKTLPPVIPQQIWDQVRAFHTPTSQDSTNTQSPIVRPGSISRVPSTFAGASSDWTISPQKRAQFDSIFEGLDKKSQGVLGPGEVAPFLMTSKLPQDVLAAIWDLADIHNTGEFTKDEFAIAMFLVQKKIAGVELPHVIPESLLPESHGAPTQAPQSYSSPTQATAQIPQIPSRDTKPSSSLSDLVDLNDAFSSSPSDTGLRTASNSTVNYTPTGTKAFVPTSTFGQKISEQSHQAPQKVNSPLELEKRTTASYFSQQPTGSAVGNIPFPQPTGFGSALSGPISSPQITTQSTQTLAQNKSFQPSVPQNNDLLADSSSEVSGQLSKATTDLANLSNQIGSLTSQTSQLHEKRTRAERELSKITELKNDIESKLSKLRIAYDQEVRQTASVESLLVTSKNETEQLRKEASVAEAQYNQVQTQLQALQSELEESQKENSSLKERLGTLNAEQIELTRQLEKTQGEVRQSKGLVAINSKQLNIAEIKSTGIREEIENLLSSVRELDSHHETYLQKQATLETSKQQLDEFEQSLALRKQQLDQAELQFQSKEAELKQRLEEQRRNEAAIEQQDQRIQSLISDLQQRQAELEKAEAQLQQQQVEYAQRVQEFSYKQIQDATSGFSGSTTVDSSKGILEEDTTQGKSGLIGGIVGAAAATAVGGTAFISNEASNKSITDDGERENTEFSSPLAATTEQATSVNSEDDQYRSVSQFPNLEIERPQSATSSVQNNAPQSVRGDDIEETSIAVDDVVTSNEQPALASDVLGKDYNPTSGATKAQTSVDESSGAGSFELVDDNKSESESTLRGSTVKSVQPNADLIESSIPGGWNVDSPIVAVADSLPTHESSSIETPVSVADTEELQTTKEKFSSGENDEFPPIQELHVDESDSEAEEEFHETYDDIPVSCGATKSNDFDGLQSAREEVDDDFADLQAANEDAGDFDDFDGLEAAQNETSFGELDDEFTETAQQNDQLDGTTFFGSEEAQAETPYNSRSQPQHGGENNEEWEQIFAGFGNQNQTTQHPTQIAQPHPQTPIEASASSTPSRPRIATTPRSLAVQELTGMGFSKEEALAALEKEKWNLESATNYLLDNA